MKTKIFFVKITVFLIIFIIGIQFTEKYMYPANGTTRNWDSFYALERNTIDCLIIGSSHAYSSFNTDILFQETGENAYILASNSQTVIQSYYNLKEVLKYQSPKKVILEAYSIASNDNWKSSGDKDWKKESNIDGMRFGLNKVTSIINQYDKENWIYAGCTFFRVHNNWKSPSYILDNFNFYKASKKFFSPFRPSTTSMAKKTQLEYKKMKEKSGEFQVGTLNKEYFHRLARLCRDHNIELYVIMAPWYKGYIEKVNYKSRYDLIEELTKEEDVVYIDGNMAYDIMELFPEHFEDAFSGICHLNEKGANIFTEYIIRNEEIW